MPESTPLFDPNIEIKSAHHKKGERRPREEATVSSNQHSIHILVSDKTRVNFLPTPEYPGEHNVVLEKPGDFVLWEPKVAHRTEVLEDS